VGPNGREIAFSLESANGDLEIEVVRLADGHVRNLTPGGGRNFNPTWSPDGTRTAYGPTKAPRTST
jgi:Tol biopolymer transport system component